MQSLKLIRLYCLPEVFDSGRFCQRQDDGSSHLGRICSPHLLKGERGVEEAKCDEDSDGSSDVGVLIEGKMCASVMQIVFRPQPIIFQYEYFEWTY